MITGPTDRIQQVAAGEPGVVFRLTPRRDYPGGSYNTSSYTQAGIAGQTLTLSTLPARVYLELQLSDWGSSLTGNGYLRIWEAYADRESYMNGEGSPLLPAIESCITGSTGSAECRIDFGVTSGPSCSRERCTFAWIDGTRLDGIQHPSQVPDCGINIWDVGNLTNLAGHNYFGVLSGEESGSHCGLTDQGALEYAGAFALDVRLGALGEYTVGLDAKKTFAQDDSQPDPLEITVAALLPAIIQIAADLPCSAAIDCGDDNACTADVCSEGVCANPLLPAGSPCGNPDADLCDQPDACNAQGTCEPRLRGSGFTCRDAGDLCDLAEKCDGQSRQCPPDAIRSGGVVCRAAAGDCDAPETCNGSSPACPTDLALPAGTLCREVAGPCDLADACDGESKFCSEQVQPNTVVCRSAANECDREETCDGSSAQCPADFQRPLGYPCAGDGDLCTQDWCIAGVCESVDDCSCAGEGSACGNGCCVVGEESVSTCSADCADFREAAELIPCVRTNTYPLGSACLAFDFDGDGRVSKLDYRIFVARYFGGP